MNKNTKKILLIVLGTIFVLFALTVFVYQKYINVSYKHESEFDYDFSEAVNETEYDISNFISQSKEPGYIDINIPKTYLYDKLINIRNINESLIDKHNVSLEKIGIYTDESDNTKIKVYSSTLYKNRFKSYSSMVIKYQINDDNSIDFIVDDITLGENLPRSFYENKLPYKVGDVVFRFDSKDYQLLANNLLSFDLFENQKIDKQSLSFSYNIVGNIENITEYIFGADAKQYNETIEAIAPKIIEFIFNEKTQDYLEAFRNVIEGLFK